MLDATSEVSEELASTVTGLTVYCPNVNISFEVPCGAGHIVFSIADTDFIATFECLCGRKHSTKIS